MDIVLVIFSFLIAVAALCAVPVLYYKLYVWSDHLMEWFVKKVPNETVRALLSIVFIIVAFFFVMGIMGALISR